MEKYVIGVDFGSLSGRAVLCRVRDGAEMAAAALDYPHGVMTDHLPCGKPLPPDWALQHPQDYLDVLCAVIPQVLAQSGVQAADVIGVGTDFTASTVMPVLADGTPLCFLPAFTREPHAYVKLWKHHGAQQLADRMTAVAQARGERWLADYGGRVSSEWSLPKLWEVLQEAPEIYEKMAMWTEAADWIVWQLTGRPTFNACCAGYKAFYQDGRYPDQSYFAALDPRLENVMAEKFPLPVSPVGRRAGGLTPAMAQRLGLLPATPVAVGHVDAHVGLAAAGIDGPGKMLLTVGTSSGHMVMTRERRQVPGICGAVMDGIQPGFVGYEAGQCSVGDLFGWVVAQCCPPAYADAARAQGISIHQYLTGLSARLAPGESGLILLDWWNGNRSVLADYDLSGMIVGLTLQTRCEEIYRAALEAVAFGTRMIVENYRRHGVAVDEIIANGGISQKNPLLMQIYADELNMPMSLSASAQGAALGSAIFAAAAAGAEAGGYASVADAARAMGKTQAHVYRPIPENVQAYDQLYREYCRLHDYFGRGENDVMKRLRSLRDHQKTRKADA